MAKEETLNSIFDGIVDSVKTSDLDKSLVMSLSNDLIRSKTLILRQYDNTRAYAKPKYMSAPDGKMDRHKVVACIMVSVLHGLKLTESGDIDGSEYIKERVAIKAGLSLLRTWITADNENFKNGKLITFLNKNNGLVLPHSICDDKPYEKNWVAELYYNQEEAKKYKCNLSILSISANLFLIESYNRALAEISDQTIMTMINPIAKVI
jgi:hypothetical protein